MYLKIRQEVSIEGKEGKSVKWHLKQVPLDIIWEWVEMKEDDYNRNEITFILSEGIKRDIVRMIVIIKEDRGIRVDAEVIYCNDNVYLCNDNGKTIEKF